MFKRIFLRKKGKTDRFEGDDRGNAEGYLTDASEEDDRWEEDDWSEADGRWESDSEEEDGEAVSFYRKDLDSAGQEGKRDVTGRGGSSLRQVKPEREPEAEKRKKLEGINGEDPADRAAYVEDCLARMLEGAREIESLRYEYNRVSISIRDMEKISELRSEERRKIFSFAEKIAEKEEELRTLSGREGQMTDLQYGRLEQLSEDPDSSLSKYEEAEEMHRKIRSDLKRLEDEKEASMMREEDLEKVLTGTRTLGVTCFITFLALTGVLLALHTMLGFEVVYGYMAAALLSALSIVSLYMRNTAAHRDLKQAQKKTSKLILLQNTVKIRYVNNRNLLDYYALKFGVKKAEELKHLIACYETEKDYRCKHQESMNQMEEMKNRLEELLTKNDVQMPRYLLKEVSYLTNREESSYLRHKLLSQRKSLRKRMDYNQQEVIGGAKNDIRELGRRYPRHAKEIAAQVDRFTEKMERMEMPVTMSRGEASA